MASTPARAITGHEVVATKQISLGQVKYSERFYPRAKPNQGTIAAFLDSIQGGDELPAIDVDEQDFVLLDGYHRWKAHEQAGKSTILANIVRLNGYPRLLYAGLGNAIHGDRLTPGEKKAIAVAIMRQQQETEDAGPSNLWLGRGLSRERKPAGAKADAAPAPSRRFTEAELAAALHVSPATMSTWVSDIVNSARRQRESQVWWLSRLGWTEREIAERIGMSKSEVDRVCPEFSDLKKRGKDHSSRGRTPAQIAEAEGVPQKLIETMLLDGKSDRARLDAMQIGIQPYDVWQFGSCDPRLGGEYPGRVPGELLLHALYFYTESGDLVVDPMVGGGTTLDACAYLGRKCYAYDAHPADGQADIIGRDLTADGWSDRVKGASLIFWDPPYYRKKDAEYGDLSISRLSRAEYLKFFDQAARTLPKAFKGRIAFLCSDFNDEEDGSENVFFWEYVRIFEAAGWRPQRRIQVPLSTQSVHPDVVVKFRDRKRLGRLGRDLVIFECS